MPFFNLASIAPTPWKNGGGSTQEIACSPAGASMDTFDWRVSVAHVARDGPFSCFEHVDRTLVLLTGEGMLLNDVRLDASGGMHHFAGETPVLGCLLNGPTTDFNVMTRRGKIHAETCVQNDAFTLNKSVGTHVLYVISGHWQINAQAVSAGQGVIDSGLPLHATRTSPAGHMLTVSFTPL